MAEPAGQFNSFPEYNDQEADFGVTAEQAANINNEPQGTSNVIPFVSRTSNVQKNYKPVPNQKDLSSRVKSVGTAAQVTGVATQGAGVAVQGTGKVVSVTGRGMTRAGAALSSTGVGAIVGVPLTATGAVAMGAGRGLEAGGKGIKKSGAKITRQGTRLKQASRAAEGMSTRKFIAQNATVRYRNNPVLRQRLNRLILANTEEDVDKAKIKSRARFLVIIGWIFSFPIVIFNGLFIYLFNAWNEVQDGGVWDIAKSAVTLNLDEAAIKTVYYFNSDMLMGFMVFCWAAGFTLAAIFLFMTIKVLSGAGAQTKNTAVKEGLFMVALIAAFMPLANVWPWTNSLVKHVAKHPE